MEQALEMMLQEKFHKGIKEASKEEIYTALLCVTKDKMKGMKANAGDRKLYYISAEFLIGKLLSNNLINLGLFEETREVLKKYGHDLTEIEEVEPEPSLGNGGLGRLAACFLDSIATLGLAGDEWALTTTKVSSCRNLQIISSGRIKTHGLRKTAG